MKEKWRMWRRKGGNQRADRDADAATSCPSVDLAERLERRTGATVAAVAAAALAEPLVLVPLLLALDLSAAAAVAEAVRVGVLRPAATLDEEAAPAAPVAAVTADGSIGLT